MDCTWRPRRACISGSASREPGLGQNAKETAAGLPKPGLDEVIAAMQKVVADNRMPVQRMRDYRAHHENWEHQ